MGTSFSGRITINFVSEESLQLTRLMNFLRDTKVMLDIANRTDEQGRVYPSVTFSQIIITPFCRTFELDISYPNKQVFSYWSDAWRGFQVEEGPSFRNEVLCLECLDIDFEVVDRRYLDHLGSQLEERFRCTKCKSEWTIVNGLFAPLTI